MGLRYAALVPLLSTGKLPLAQTGGAGKMPLVANPLYDRIKQRIDELGLTAREVSMQISGTPDLIRNIKRGKSESLRGPRLLKLAEAIGVSAHWLQTGEDGPAEAAAPPRMIPVVGYVGAGAEVFCIDDHAKGAGLDEVEMPFPGMSRSAVAVRVRGDSMEPAYHDGDLIFYDMNENGDLIHLIGKECVVSLADGRKFVKTLRRRANGDWYLFSYNAEPIMDIEIDWAAKVEWVKRA